MQEIGFAILGAGMVARYHATAIERTTGARLVAVGRSDPARAEETAAQFGVPCMTDYAALLARADVDAVCICTPSGLHAQQTIAAARAGKHVLVEKPVATTVAQWHELTALARQQGRQLLAYQNRRWDTDFGAVRRIVKSGQLGRLIEVHFRYDRYRPALHTKVFKEDGRPGSGLLFDLGPHLVDQAIALFGKPLSFEKTLGSYRHGSQVPDYFTIQLRYPHGLNVWLTAGLLVADPGPAFVLHGTQGSYTKDRTDPQEAQLLAGIKPNDPAYGRERVADQPGRLVLADPAGHNRVLPPVADVAAPGNYLGLFEDVYQAIRHGQPYPITDEELEWQLEILE